MPIMILFNPSAGAGHNPATEAPHLRETLFAHGLKADVVVTTGPSLAAAAAEAVREHPRMLIVAGGDGSVSTVASILSGTQIPLGIIPLGSRNSFARDLGIPVDRALAAKVIAAGNTRDVDVAEVNGRIFVNHSSIGIYPAPVRRGEWQARLGKGRLLSIFQAIIHALRRSPVLHVQFRTSGGHAIERRTPFVFVGNGNYELDLLAIGRRTAIDNGRLGLYVANRPGRLGLLLLAARSLMRRLDQTEDFYMTQLAQLRVESRSRRLTVALDGEIIRLVPPLNYRVHPRALRVIVPVPAAPAAVD